MMRRAGAPVRELQRCVQATLDLFPTLRNPGLPEEPEPILAAEFGLEIQRLASVESDCGIAGRYYDTTKRIAIESGQPRSRERFTLLHELGHHVAYDTDEFIDLLDRYDEHVEEDFCDALAARILLPPDIVNDHISLQGPTAQSVADLFDATPASREACAVAAANRLAGAGYVIVADLDGTVRFAARNLTPYRIARDTPQPNSVLATAGSVGHGRSSEERLRYRTGGWTDAYAIDAVRDGRYVFAIATRGRPAWETGVWSPPSDAPPSSEAECANAACEHVWTAFGSPCPSCGDYLCPACGRCGCASVTTVTVRCGDCGLDAPQHDLDDGICSGCR